MKKREILTDPNPILRAETENVSSFDGEIQSLIDDMIYTMRQSEGIGLAAPQVGELKKIFVAEYETPAPKGRPLGEKGEDEFPLTVLINPEIKTTSDDKQFMIEGCLSFPGKELYVKRPTEIEVAGQDRWGKKVNLKCTSLLARVLQHEKDHLDGVLMIDHIKVAKTLFIGNGTLGLPVLEKMADDPQFNILGVITAFDQKFGRKGELESTPITTLAEKLKQKVYKIKDINDAKTALMIKKLGPELIVLADFGQILSKEIISIPKYGVLNIHPSLLPKYRGPSPVVSAILNGDKRTGVTIIKLNQVVDGGDILSQIEAKIKPRETSTLLKKRLAELGSELLVETVPYYLAGEIQPVVQKDEAKTLTKQFTKAGGKLSGKESPEIIDRMVRALNPWPGVYTEVANPKGVPLGAQKVFITKSHLDKEKKLIIDAVKPEGKREMSYKEYLAGHDQLTFAD